MGPGAQSVMISGHILMQESPAGILCQIISSLHSNATKFNLLMTVCSDMGMPCVQSPVTNLVKPPALSHFGWIICSAWELRVLWISAVFRGGVIITAIMPQMMLESYANLKMVDIFHCACEALIVHVLIIFCSWCGWCTLQYQTG